MGHEFLPHWVEHIFLAYGVGSMIATMLIGLLPLPNEVKEALPDSHWIGHYTLIHKTLSRFSAVRQPWRNGKK